MNPSTLRRIEENYDQVGRGTVKIFEDASGNWGRELPDDVDGFNQILFFIDLIYEEAERNGYNSLYNQAIRPEFTELMITHLQILSDNGFHLNTEGVARNTQTHTLSALFEKVLTADNSYAVNPHTIPYRVRRNVTASRLISHFYGTWGDLLRVDCERSELLAQMYMQHYVSNERVFDLEVLGRYLHEFQIPLTGEMIRTILAISDNHAQSIEEDLISFGLSGAREDAKRVELQEDYDLMFTDFLADFILLQHFEGRFVGDWRREFS